MQIGDSREILAGIAGILVSCGHAPLRLVHDLVTYLMTLEISKTTLEQLKALLELCEKLPLPATTFDPENLEYVAKLPDVIADWNEMPEYVENGKPRRLSSAALAKLIGGVFPERAPGPVVKDLIRLGAARRKGKLYECLHTHLVFTGPEAHWRALVSIHAHVQTLGRNLRGVSTVFEQSAISARLPVRDRSVVEAIAQSRGLPVLHGLDSEIRRRARKAAPNEKRAWSGVGMYLIDIPVSSHPIRKSPPKHRQADSKSRNRHGKVAR